MLIGIYVWSQGTQRLLGFQCSWDLGEQEKASSKSTTTDKINLHLNPSPPNPGERVKFNLIFYFHTSLRYVKRFYESL